jgi:phenylalanyl-tRNA synthetase alpha chain
MKNKLQNLKQEILEQLEKTADILNLENLEKKYFSRQGEFTLLLKTISGLPEAERKEIGQLANEIKTEIKEKLIETKKKLGGSVGATDSFFDVTLPGTEITGGHLHPLTLVQRELEKIFSSMGFMILDGPELESDYYNFEALNIPESHPARDMQDTFFIDKKNKQGEYDLVMRTQTSNMQVRAMEKYGAPLRCAVMGATYRNEATDMSHEHSFYQIENLVVDKGISLANLIGVLETMFSGLYRQKVSVRLRPGYFPFVEPGLEAEMSCIFCQGKGCSVCKRTGWLEMGGAGLVHPNVLKYGGVDPKKYQGLAFGFGIERLAMLKYGIDNIRLFRSGDLSFLKQF